MIVSIHQPEHLPWLGFFNKMSLAEEFIILDNVQFRKNYFQNRNRIRSQTGWQWITVPIIKHHITDKIYNIKIVKDNTWIEKNSEIIKNNYKKAPFFHSYYDNIISILSVDTDFLADINIKLIEYIKKELKIETTIKIASDIVKDPGLGGSEVVLNICNKLGAEVYISGKGGYDYLDLKKFEKEGIKVIFQKFQHPEYKQCYKPFIPEMSVIDLLFNHGENSRKILGLD